MKADKWQIFATVVLVINMAVIVDTIRMESDRDQQIIADLIEQRKELKEELAVQEKTIQTLEKPFTYLDDLSEEERAAYKQFQTSKDIQVLELSAEKTLLVYLHLASNNDLEGLYALTNTQQTLEEFQNTYVSSQQEAQDLEAVLLYRYYDDVRILEDELDDSNVNVEISISQASHQQVAIYRLTKTNGKWQLAF